MQYDAEWSGEDEQAEFYRRQANHYREEIKQGILLEPTFFKVKVEFFQYKTVIYQHQKDAISTCIVSINGTMHTLWRWDVVSLKFCSIIWHG